MIIPLLFLISSKFQDLNLDGHYKWRRLNNVGHEFTGCLDKNQMLLEVESDLEGSLQIIDDKMISLRQKGSCSIEETIQLVHLDNKIAVLKIEDIQTKNCKSSSEVTAINVERPYDDENLSFASSFKILEISKKGNQIEFRHGDNCFYAIKD